MRYYYIDRENKIIFVYDTFQEGSSYEYLGPSDHPNHKVAASMFVRNGVGFRIVIVPLDPS